MAADPLILSIELVARLGSAVAVATFDDDNDGVADEGPMAAICADASSKVRGALRGVYDLALLDAETQHELKRIALDIAHAMAAMRRPDRIRADWPEMLKSANADLMNIRKGVTALDAEPNPKAANQGGSVGSGILDDPEPLPRVFDNMGDF